MAGELTSAAMSPPLGLVEVYFLCDVPLSLSGQPGLDEAVISGFLQQFCKANRYEFAPCE